MSYVPATAEVTSRVLGSRIPEQGPISIVRAGFAIAGVIHGGGGVIQQRRHDTAGG